jgi:outer membrane autotransporter protein
MSLASSGASTLYACSGSGTADIELKAEYVTVSGNDSANGDFYVLNRDAAAGNTISVKGTISLTDEKAGGIIAESTGANSLISLQSASLDLKDSSGYIAKATNSGVIRLNYDAASDSYIAGNASHLEGALSAASAEIYAGLDGTGTTFTGSADDGSFEGRSGAGKITVKAANGALWTVKPFNPEGTSSVFSNLWLYNSSGSGKRGITSTVDLTTTETAQDLYITNLSGAGAEFVLRTQVDANRTGSFRDHVIVGSGEGSHFILVKAVGLASEDANDWTEEVQADYLVAHYEKNGATSQALTLDSSGKVVAAAASGSPLSFSLANANGEVDYGNYRYVLQTREITDKDGVTGTEWYLRRAGAPTENDDTFTEDPDCTGDGCNKPDEEEKEPDPSCTGDNCGTGDTPKEDTPKDETPKGETPSTFERTPETTTAQNQSFKNLSSSAQLASTLAGYGTMYSAWNANLTTLRKRLGEVRYGAQEGVWTRFIWQKDKTDGMTGGRFEQKLKGLQIGADHIVAQNEDRMWLVGANFKYAKGDQKVKGMTKGEGDMDAYGAFLYATYANYKGYYTDLVLSLDHYTEKMHALQTDYTVTRGSFNTWGWGASVEAGRMFSSTQSDEGWGPWYANWWIEPQVQLSYYTGKGQNFTMSNGMTVDQKNGQSLVGRAGVVAGRKFNSPEDRTMVTKDYSQFYIKGGVKHEFLGKETVRLNGERFSGSLKGTRVYYGAGVDDSDEDLRFYAQFEREHGSKYQKDAEVSFGVKVEF